jgi:hypothetical protein
MSPSEQGPPAWVMSLMQGIRTEMATQHAEMRKEVADGFTALRGEMRVQNGRVAKSEERLTAIETAMATERRMEDRASGHRWPMAAVLVGALAGFVLQIIKAWVEK